jgi:hypothetical protein
MVLTVKRVILPKLSRTSLVNSSIYIVPVADIAKYGYTGMVKDLYQNLPSLETGSKS